MFHRVLSKIRTNQSNFSPLIFSQSAIVEYRNCDINDKNISSCFYESKKIFGRLVRREKVYLRNNQKRMKKCNFKGRIWLNIIEAN